MRSAIHWLAGRGSAVFTAIIDPALNFGRKFSCRRLLTKGETTGSSAPMGCPRCGLQTDLTARFCPGCGEALPVMSGAPREAVPEANGDPAAAKAASRPKTAHLVVISQDGSTGEMHALEADSVDIGRDVSGIQLATDGYVSPRHARISRRGGAFFLRDLDSLNGVYLRLRAPEALRQGDLVLLGSEVLAYEEVSNADQGFEQARQLDTEVYGSPIRPRFARLRQKTMEGVDRSVFYLSEDRTVVGRETGDIVFTTDSFMSRKHAAFERDSTSGGVVLKDLGSSNGTYLAIRGEVPLQEGDHLRVGQHLFRFGLEG